MVILAKQINGKITYSKWFSTHNDFWKI
jgi:hypothetical protein